MSWGGRTFVSPTLAAIKLRQGWGTHFGGDSSGSPGAVCAVRRGCPSRPVALLLLRGVWLVLRSLQEVWCRPGWCRWLFTCVLGRRRLGAGSLDGQAEACPFLMPLHGQVRSRFPDGNDRQKNNGKGNSRSFALLRIRSGGLERAFVSPTLAAKDASRMGHPLWW